MSAAANAAGYLYAHGQLVVSHLDEAAPRMEPKTAPSRAESGPIKQVRTPRIEYRKRRFYALPSAA